MVRTKTTARDKCLKLMLDEVETAWELAVQSTNRNVLTACSDGAVYYQQFASYDSIGEAEYFGRKRAYWSLQEFGNLDGDSGMASYETHEIEIASDNMSRLIEREIDDADLERTTSIQTGGAEWRCDSVGDETGVAGQWYRVTDSLLAWNEGAWADQSPEEIFEEAIETLESIPIGFFDDEEPGPEWRNMND